MPKLDLDRIPQTNASRYPTPFATVVQERRYRRLAPAGGLTDFGATHVTLAPGAWSAQRHWHEGEDELVVILAGAATLVDDTGRTPMRAGDVATFPKGDGNGHCLVNETAEPCVYLAVGRASASACHYPDIDLHITTDGRFVHKDGSDY